MDTKEHDNKNNPVPQDEKQSKKEHAINRGATEGEKVNQQVAQKKETHQPRDNA